MVVGTDRHQGVLVRPVCRPGLSPVVQQPLRSGVPGPKCSRSTAWCTRPPALLARLVRGSAREEEALAEALRAAAAAQPSDGAQSSGGAQPSDVAPRLAAAQLVAVHQVLAHENWRKIVDGRTATEVHDEAARDSDRAFQLLGAGLAEQYG